MGFKKITFLAAIAVLVAGTLSFGRVSAAGDGTLYISPSSGTHMINSTFTVTVRENSGTTPVNAVSYNGTYNQSLLEFQSFDFTTSAFEIAASSSGGSGAINIDRGTTSNTLTGDQVVGRMTFKVLAIGQATITVENSSVVLQTSDSTDQVGTRTGTTLKLINGFHNRVAHIPTGHAFYFNVDKSYYVPNPTVRNCIYVRHGTGPTFLTSIGEVNSFTDGGQTAHCPYEKETGLNFVKEKSSHTIWLVRSDASKIHVGSLCVGDPFTTVLKKFHVFIVPDGETWGHVQSPGAWWASGSNCAALPG